MIQPLKGNARLRGEHAATQTVVRMVGSLPADPDHSPEQSQTDAPADHRLGDHRPVPRNVQALAFEPDVLVRITHTDHPMRLAFCVPVRVIRLATELGLRAHTTPLHGWPMKIAIFALVALLCGCVAQRMNDGLEGFVGRRIQWAVDRLGYPDGQRQFMDDTIYIWSINRQALLPFTNTTTTTGIVGSTPVYGNTYSTQMTPVNATCTIQLAVGSDGFIKHYQWEGNPIGCQRYMRAFH